MIHGWLAIIFTIITIIFSIIYFIKFDISNFRTIVLGMFIGVTINSLIFYLLIKENKTQNQKEVGR